MILELREIYKDYQQGKLVVPVLKHVNFSMEEGEYTAIMGPSGSGKNDYDEHYRLSGQGDIRRFLFGWTGYQQMYGK